MVILTLHILVASVMTVTMVGVFTAAYRRHETAAYQAMLASFGVTILSGIGLLFVSPTGLGRLCVMMSIFTILVVAVRAYYRKQVISVTASL